MTDRLERYREMRDFARTQRIADRHQLHYYIQRHDATRLHYDFRLELEGVLKSWRGGRRRSRARADGSAMHELCRGLN
jgi:hypothetical protein